MRCKATSLTISLGLPVHGKYLMAKSIGFADQCKLSSARPASEARATWQLLLSLLFREGSGEQLQETEFTYKFIFVQMERTSPSRCFFQVGSERRRFIHFAKEAVTILASFDILAHLASIRIYYSFDGNILGVTLI